MVSINKEREENLSKSLFLSIVAIIILMITVISLSFAMIIYSKEGTIVNTIQTGTLMMTYTEGQTGISITDALPMSDEAGKKLSKSNEMFKFTVSSEIRGNATINYEIAAIKKAESTINDNEVRLYLEKSVDGNNYQEVFAPNKYTPLKGISAIGSPEGSMILESGEFDQTQTNYYILRMWLSNEGDNIPSGSYVVTVNVYGNTK